ncbi:hypothetical protein BS47DRAFT_1333112 [Hydnum rufescens UP504]|uniref:DNA polymerase eta n=1 Tax=Hydnum rufescens UP504 TaxID=1448309 RepID=A0A9P6DRK8_9AGAM|nr:hypothetical protein BS47DRAFT_1333112 [Hydnum rufescens UP504]
MNGKSSPTVTYRHILGNVPVVYNPLRVVALCDNDAFYASVERVRLGLGEDVPLAVVQWNSLIAVSHPARKYGIKRMETSVQEAKKLCPELVAVHTATYKDGDPEPAYHENPDPRTHKVSLDLYRRESKRIVDVYQELLPPGGELEKASIDECFFCLSQPVRDILVQRYPHIGRVPPDAPLGLDTPLPPPPSSTPWEGLGNLVPITTPTPPFNDTTTISATTPITNSPNKVQPTLGSSKAFENGENAAAGLEDLTWHDIALCIGAELMLEMRKAVKERLGYTTSAGIARNKVLAKLVASYKKLDQQTILRNAAIAGYWRPMPFQNIRNLGGKLGKTLSAQFEAKTVGELEHISLAEMQSNFGEESIWVWHVLRGIDHSEVSDRVATKSMLSAKNIRPAITNVSDGEGWIRVLSAELALRLSEARDITPNLWPKSLAIHIRQDSDPTKSKQCPFPYMRILSAHSISTIAFKLWKEITRHKPPQAKIHNISLSFSGLEATEIGQQSIEGFFEGTGAARKRSREHEADDMEDEYSFICSQCSKRIVLNQSVRGESEEMRANAMAALRVEHEDYHFARNLARDGSDSDEESRSRSSAKKKKKPSKDGQARGRERGLQVTSVPRPLPRSIDGRRS